VQALINPGLRRAARFLPRSANLVRGLRFQRLAFSVIGVAGARPGVRVVRVPGGPPVRVHQPPGASDKPGPVLLWIHGGGYVLGTARQDDVFCRRLAAQTAMTVVAVDYRLAPEHPYPAAVEDCYAALRWVVEQSWAAAGSIVVGGASAGGGLAAAVALEARDRGETALAGQLLTYPMLDDRTTAENPSVLMWSAADNARAWDWYLGTTDRHHAVPGRRTDLSGLPPTWIGVGTLDLFHDECLRYAEALTSAGVSCGLEISPGAFHAFDQVAPKAPVARRFFESQCEFLTQVVSTRS
jgi:acetyl esterase/lipase